MRQMGVCGSCRAVTKAAWSRMGHLADNAQSVWDPADLMFDDAIPCPCKSRGYPLIPRLLVASFQRQPDRPRAAGVYRLISRGHRAAWQWRSIQNSETRVGAKNLSPIEKSFDLLDSPIEIR